MGIYFRKSWRIVGGLRFNLSWSKRGPRAGFSWGPK